MFYTESPLSSLVRHIKGSTNWIVESILVNWTSCLLLNFDSLLSCATRGTISISLEVVEIGFSIVHFR